MFYEDKERCKEAYLDALSMSSVDRTTLKKIHDVNDNILDKWLYVPTRAPNFRSCFELYVYLRKSRRPVSRKLRVLINESLLRAISAVSN